MAVKEKDLPQVASLSGVDYVRAVSSGGTSEIVPYSALESEFNDGIIDLDTTASPGTTDGDLYAAIVAIGWENDVIE